MTEDGMPDRYWEILFAGIEDKELAFELAQMARDNNKDYYVPEDKLAEMWEGYDDDSRLHFIYFAWMSDEDIWNAGKWFRTGNFWHLYRYACANEPGVAEKLKSWLN